MGRHSCLQRSSKYFLKMPQVKVSNDEQVAVKWLQIILMLNAVAIMAVFGAQAGIRRKARSPAAKGF